MDNTVSNLQRLEKTKITFLLSETLLFFLERNILFSETHFIKISKNLITSTFLFAKVDTKKDRSALAKALNAALVKLID